MSGSTTIRSEYAQHVSGLAAQVKVYSGDNGRTGPALIVDLQNGTDEKGIERLGVLALTRDEAAAFLRAVVREGVITDLERISIAHLLLSGLRDENAEVTDRARRDLAVTLQKIADGEF